MDTRYRPEEIESRWYNFWEQQGLFKPTGTGKPYCIMLPPPNVTGSLHMGHGFQHTLMDILIRYHRMCGEQVLWQCGTDHAGIATQMVVERQVEAQGSSRQQLGREKFLERVWQWKHRSGSLITAQMRRLGSSLDWSRQRFTMDEEMSSAVIEAFVRLYQQGLIYRGKRLVNWDPQLHTAISDLEVVNEEEKGSLWHFRYPLAHQSGCLVVATTRPETMFGDTAVAVHPDDSRYRHLIGSEVKLPLTGRLVPIIADDYVDADFGTGCVKITPAHDFNDYAVGQRHGLEMINILTPDAALNKNVPQPFRDLDRFAAREQVVEEMSRQGLLDSIKEHRYQVPRGDRSGQILEPYLTDQWFVRAGKMAGEAIAAVESGTVRFVPEHWQSSYFSWMRDIQDWCISRQLWWGHRIPVWYGTDGQYYVGRCEAEVRDSYGLNAEQPLRRDEDVLDTWFSSALWSFATLGWPAATDELGRYHPTSVLVTGFDIIFFWVARMIMCSLQLQGEIPFREVYVTGLVRDARGQKMSKSKGNVLDPIDLMDGISIDDLVAKRLQGLMQPQLAKRIEKQTRHEFPDGIDAHGADALRFTFAALASTARDLNFEMGRVRGYRNFCTKLWNASRYVLSICPTGPGTDSDDRQQQISVADRWIQVELDNTIQKCRSALDSYRFDLYAASLYDFVWHQYCDWYLELVKILLPDSLPDQQSASQFVALEVLEKILCLAHPVIPFITEEIWQRLREDGHCDGSALMRVRFPECQSRSDPPAQDDINWVKEIVTAIRSLRGEFSIPFSSRFDALLRSESQPQRQLYQRNKKLVCDLAGLDNLHWQDDHDASLEVISQPLAAVEVMIPIAGVVDKQRELKRLDRQIARCEADISTATATLQRSGFVDKAPEDKVAEVRSRLAEHQQALHSLRRQQRILSGAGNS